MRELVETIIKEKIELAKLVDSVRSKEDELVRKLARDGRSECLSINWTRLCRMEGITPAKYRV